MVRNISIDVARNNEDIPFLHINREGLTYQIGMYEEGKIKRQLFNMTTADVVLLRDTLDMLLSNDDRAIID